MASNQIMIPDGFEIEYNPNEIPEGFEVENQNQQALNDSIKEVSSDDEAIKSSNWELEQLSNLLFTSEEIEAIQSKGKIGWWEYAKNFANYSDAVPFYGLGKSVKEAGNIYNIAKKIENGEEVSAQDKEFMQKYLREYAEIQLRGLTWGSQGANILINTPAFIGEFALTGGLGGTAGKVAAIGAVKGAGAAATKAAIKAGSKIATSKAASKILGVETVERIGTKGALDVSAKILGETATRQAVLVPMYAVQNFNEQKIADGLNITEKGQNLVYDTQKAETEESVLKSLTNAEIEVLSEMSGGLIGYVAGGVKNAVGKAIGNVATTNVARGISAVSAKIYNSLPKDIRVKLEASAKVVDDFSNRASDLGSKVKNSNIGFHGVAEEMGEERLADVMRYAFDLDEEEGYSLDQLGSAIFPSWQQLLLEAGVFSIVGSASLATRTVVNDLVNKGYSREEATNVANNLSEIEKENMANEILGEVKINEDITEEEVIQEQEAIQLKLFGGVEETVQAEEVMFDVSKYTNVQNKAIKNFIDNHKNYIEDEPEIYTGDKSIKGVLDYLGSTDNKTAKIKTPIEEITLNRGNLKHLIEENEKARVQNLFNKTLKTMQNPNLIIQTNEDGTNYNYYIKAFKKENNKVKSHLQIIKCKPDGNFYVTNYSLSNKKFEDLINNGQIIYDLSDLTASAQSSASVNNIIASSEQNLNPAETIVDKIIKGESKWGQFYTDWVDRLTPIENLVKKAETRAEVPFADNPYYQARMYAGLTESIKQQIEDKTFIKTQDGKIEVTGEGFLPIIKDYVEEVKDIEPNYDVAIEDLSNYLIANRYLLDLKDREGYEATEEQKLKALKDMAELNIKYGDKINDISKIADRIYEFNRRILHNLVDSGNMSQETYDKIITDNPHHISYKRVMDDEFGVSVSANNKFTDAKSPIKKIRGSERDIQNVFVSTLEDVARILDIAERNKVAKSIANLKNVVPEYIEKVKPLMEKRPAKFKVTYDAKMRRQFEEAIKFFGRTFENVKSIKTPTGYALGSYSEAEKTVRKKLGSQDRTLAHEVGHMIDFALNVENKIKKDAQIMKEITKLAEDRFASIVKLQDGEFVFEEGENTEKYKSYVKTNKEMIANMFDLYFTSRDYLREVAPNTYKFIDGLFVDKYKFLKDIRPSSETATEKIEQDVWTPSRQKPYGNVIEYFENGKRQFVEVTKPVMEAVEGLNSQEIDFINKFWVGSASMLRKGATITPEFALRNFIRDQQSATIYIDNYNPLVDMSKGLFNVLGKKFTGKNEVYDEWVNAGGAFASYMELNEKSVDKALREFVGEKSGLRKIFNPLKPLEEFSSIFEQATRLSMYTRSKLNGASALEAAFESREGTLDFGRSGKQGRLWNKKLPFFNASIQGTDRLIRAFKKNFKLVAIKAIGTMTIPQLALAGYYLFAAPDDDRKEYLNIPQYQKDFFYCFKVGDNWVRIPKDFTLGYIFASIPERVMTWLAENNKPEGKELAEMAMTLVGSASPVNIKNPLELLPPVVKTVVENTTNWDLFRGRHIYPEYLNNVEPSQRAEKYTSETAKALGEALNISPAKIDHTINSLLGSSGRYITDAGDLMINSVRQFNEEEINEKPTSLADAPFLRGFVLRDPVGYQAVSTNEFFENYKKVSTIDKTYKRYKSNNEVEKAIEYREKHGQEINAFKRMDRFNKRIKELGKRMDKIYSNSSLSKEEKQEMLQPLSQQISDTAFQANVWYGEFIKE